VDPLIGLCCFIGMILLVLVGVPIFISLLSAAAIGFWLVGGSTLFFTQFTNAPYNITSDYTFAVIPLFILMGTLAGASGVAEGIYTAAVKWVGRFRGGLAIATVGSATLLGACISDPGSTSAVLSKIALPELTKYRYDKKISLGCIAGSGPIACLIPPSIMVIIVCILTQLSVGKLLVAGIIPGILTAIAYFIGIIVIAKRRPETMPKVEILVSWKDKFLSLLPIWPVIFLFVIMIGGIYAGVFPPTLGGAIGAAGVFIFGLCKRKRILTLLNCFLETTLINAQLFIIVISGFLFSRFLVVSGMVDTFVSWIIVSGLPPLGVMAGFVVVLLFLGCIVDPMSMMIITVPAIFPTLTTLGFDGIAVGIIIVMLVNIAVLTPPLGMTVFITAAVAEVDTMEVFRGVMPFMFLSLVVLWLVILFPHIATWLPGLMY
jgi:C4-dicarboxylate transporter DctM subunit